MKGPEENTEQVHIPLWHVHIQGIDKIEHVCIGCVFNSLLLSKLFGSVGGYLCKFYM